MRISVLPFFFFFVLMASPLPGVGEAWGQSPAGNDDAVELAGSPPAAGQAQPAGALSDASIYLSAGHGWQVVNGNWVLQRPVVLGYNEDRGTAETVFQYLHQYLWNAGARIYTTRERCMNTNMVIVTPGGDGYSETGSWTVESNSRAYQGSQRHAATVAGEPTATARFTPNIPEAGHYGVYVWYAYPTEGAASADTRIHINHTGDSTLWVQNQGRDGNTWKYIGSYYFDEGANPETGSVLIDNQSGEAGNRVIAGAVRFGGGMGDVVDGGTVSGKPRWEESGRHYAAFGGMEDWQFGDRQESLANWAGWKQESWEVGKSAYVSWHTNAFNGSVRGTETWSDTNATAGSDQLRNFIHHTVIRDFATGWDPGWAVFPRDRGVKKGGVSGELSPVLNPNMPATLIELAFHDNADDAKHLLDPEFRRDAARAVYKGLVQYFHNHVPGFDNSTYLPEPPRLFRAVEDGDGNVTLSWAPPVSSSGEDAFYGHPATGYRIYRSYNGKGFDNGRDVSGVGNTGYTFEDLEPGRTVYFRVSATNAGGESFPTATLAVRPSEAAGADRVLLVHGFDRLDRFLNVVENPGSASALQRGYLPAMNTFDYAIQHAVAIEAFGEDVTIDSAIAQAVDAGMVGLGDYRIVIWMAGQQADVNDIGDASTPVFTSGMRNRLQIYLTNGGRLFISGSEIAYDQHQAGASGWLQNVLKVEFHQRSAGSNTFRGESASIMADILATGFGAAEAPYRVEFADAVNAIGGSVPMLRYLGDPSNPQVVDGFEGLGGWWQPAASGSTNGDAGGSFGIVSNPVHDGSGAGHLAYTWGTTGTFIRLFNSGLPAFSADSDFSVWIYGDNSGHNLRLAVRDEENRIFVNPYTAIDFTGWQEIVWQDVRNNLIYWAAGPGSGPFTGDNARWDSIQISKTAGGPATGDLYFDLAVSTPAAAEQGDLDFLAGVQYDEGYQVVYLATPFESIGDSAKRATIMGRALSFFGVGRSPFENWQELHFTKAEREDPQISGEFADASKDGIPNIVKYAFNLDPREPSRDGLPEVSVEGDFLTFRFNQAKEATDIVYEVEISDDLLSWESGDGEVELVGSVDEGETWRVTVRDRTPFPDSERRFVRLKVTR